MPMRAHKLKTWPRYFRAVSTERKPFELRKADRDFQVGDYLCLVEFDPETDALTGAYTYRVISYVLTSADAPRGLIDGFVVLGMETIDGIEISRLNGTYDGLLQEKVEWLQPLAA
jgi:hypothetical protein